MKLDQVVNEEAMTVWPWQVLSVVLSFPVFDAAGATFTSGACTLVIIFWAPSSEFVSSSIPSWQILTAHAQPFRGARDLAFCLKVPLDSLLVWASSEGSGETARMRRLAWTFAARICYKYQIRLTRSIWCIALKSFKFWIRAPMHESRKCTVKFNAQPSAQRPPTLKRYTLCSLSKKKTRQYDILPAIHNKVHNSQVSQHSWALSQNN